MFKKIKEKFLWLFRKLFVKKEEHISDDVSQGIFLELETIEKSVGNCISNLIFEPYSFDSELLVELKRRLGSLGPLNQDNRKLDTYISKAIEEGECLENNENVMEKDVKKLTDRLINIIKESHNLKSALVENRIRNSLDIFPIDHLRKYKRPRGEKITVNDRGIRKINTSH